ncbi:MAG: 50S ribosomal protein L9 [Chloroflexota bacterium]|jgi:large subunit ribosomal protein L9
MKVLLKEDVYNLGYAGEVHEVANGYGNNYLIPKGLAIKATPNVMKQANVYRKRAEAHRAEVEKKYRELADKIRETTLTFTAKAGESGRLYGSVTTFQIADALNEALGTEIDRRKVGAGSDSLRDLGKHEVTVRLDADHQVDVTVIIEPEDEDLMDLMEDLVEDEDEVETAELDTEVVETAEAAAV